MAKTVRRRQVRGSIPASGDALARLLRRGLEQHRAGDLGMAAASYRQVLDTVPEQPDALHLLGVVHHQSGDHAAAASLIERSLKGNPRNADAHSNLGAALNAMGDAEAAERCFRRAIEIDPGHLTSHTNLAGLAVRRGADGEAIASFRAAHNLKPGEPRFIKRLAELYLKNDQYREAQDWFERYLAFVPNDPDALNNAALSLQHLGRFDEAEARFRRAYRLCPDKPELGNNLANMLRALGKPEEAARIFDRVLETDPLHWDDVSHYAGALFNNGRLEKALALYEALTLERPGDSALHSDYGKALVRAGRLEEAENAYRQAVRLDPSSDGARIPFAHCLLRSRRIDEAAEVLSSISPESPHYLPALLDLSYIYAGDDRHAEACEAARGAAGHPDFKPSMFVRAYTVFRDACAFDDIEALEGSLADIDERDLQSWASVFLELLVLADTPEACRSLADLHRRWGETLVSNASADALPQVDLAARSGKIRLGFLSSDLRQHAVARFVLPLLENFDRDRFDIYCYAPEENRSDVIQNRIRGLVKEFRVLSGLGHRATARLIREDRIDILFELNGFTADSRLPVLAYRPAPVQVYWLGYPFTCGLPSVDYILLDNHLVAPEAADFLVEKPLCMPNSWVCYDPFESVTPAEELPCDRNGFVTFGTLNNPYKFTRAAIAAWSAVMRQSPRSRCAFVHPEYKSRVIVENISREFERNGIDRDRLSFEDNRAQGGSHFDYYKRFDLTLDSFPLTGGTSTCDALWMGVPVVSLKGAALHQRLSYSLLCSVGLESLCAETEAAFVENAVALAGDAERLRRLRDELRTGVRCSPLAKADRFGRDFCNVMNDLVERHGLRRG